MLDTSHPTESQLDQEDRAHVAALCRLMAHHRMGDAANQVVAVRSRAFPDALVTHRLGAFFDDVTASQMATCDYNGTDLHTGQKLPFGEIDGLNAGILNLTVPIFQTRPEINCLIHGHSKAIMVVSMLEGGLRAVSQPALYILPRMGYWPYIFDEDETFRGSFAEAFQGRQVLMARNHGFYAVGRTPAEAFFLTFYLSQACDAQISAMACGDRLLEIPEVDASRIWDKMQASIEYHYDGSMEWPGWMRMVQRLAPDYAS